MIKAPTPDTETERQAALNNLQMNLTTRDELFERIIRLAAMNLNVPIALLSLVSEQQQIFKSNIGLHHTDGSLVNSTPRDISFCGHAVAHDSLLIVPDTLQDNRFFDNPLVVGAPHIRFYAGCPVHTPDGHAIGTLCVIDTIERHLSPNDIQTLVDLASIIETEIQNQKK